MASIALVCLELEQHDVATTSVLSLDILPFARFSGEQGQQAKAFGTRLIELGRSSARRTPTPTNQDVEKQLFKWIIDISGENEGISSEGAVPQAVETCPCPIEVRQICSLPR